MSGPQEYGLSIYDIQCKESPDITFNKDTLTFDVDLNRVINLEYLMEELLCKGLRDQDAMDEIKKLKKEVEWLTSKILEVMYAYSDETISRVNEIKENLK
jgi:hypothetical protein